MTTKTILALRFMADGLPVTVLSVSTAIGCPLPSARYALSLLVKEGYALSVRRPTWGKPASYLITISGFERSKFVPKDREQLSRERYERVKKAAVKVKAKTARVTFQKAQKASIDTQRAQAVEAAVRRAELQVAADSIVMLGRSSRTPLEMAWGSCNA